MFGLETDIFILLSVSLLAACAFEFVNGFHDTANAVATVIYTNALKPTIAVVLSGIFNFVGVLLGGIGVAMGIVNLLPIELLVDQNVYHSLAMVFALLLSAIIWNVGTWYFGLPSSSSHTLIGSILGVGLAFSTLGVSDGGVNWEKAIETGYALLLSPLLGFSLVIVLMFLIRRIVPEENKAQLFKEPKKNTPPPTWIRATLIATCSMVSFVHGSNDGQKGVGLVMLILIGVVPFQFAIKPGLDPALMQGNLVGIEQTINALNPLQLSGLNRGRLDRVRSELTELKKLIATPTADREIPKEKRLDIRRDLLLINSNMNKIAEDEGANLSSKQLAVLKDSLSETNGLRRFTDYAPLWVILMIALSLGLGTMIGWRRIVVTVGEKIGKQHLTYAQGASAELTAAVMIGLASWMKLPVSTTHVLSSGIAGSMVANKGIKNLQASTVRNIALAWVLTLPVSVLLSFTLFLFFRWLF